MNTVIEQIKLLPKELFRLLRWSENVHDADIIATDGSTQPYKDVCRLWHSHPEFELVLISSGSGIRFIGDSTIAFTAPDIVLSGSNLPHLWKCHGIFSGYVLQFSFGPEQPFWKLHATAELREFLNKAQRGIQFKGRIVLELTDLIQSIPKHRGIGQFALFMLLLEKMQMADNNSLKLLSKKSFRSSESRSSHRGIQKAVHFVLNNFDKNFSLGNVLSESGMSKATFERQFRKKTGKTFTQFLGEVRIDAASRQLIETDLSISEIAFASGFNNLSTFNRQFSTMHGQSPRTFRRKMKFRGLACPPL